MSKSRFKTARNTVLLACVLAAALAQGSCTPAHYRKQADTRAYDIVKRANEQELGKSEPFTIETPADTLRRRLLLDQKLPVANVASLGVSALKPIPHWPEKKYPAHEDFIINDDMIATKVGQACSAPASEADVANETQPASAPAATEPGATEAAASGPAASEATAPQEQQESTNAVAVAAAPATQPASAPAASEPAASQPGHPLILSLMDALQIAAKGNKVFQSQKEDLFERALALDLEENNFRILFANDASGKYIEDRTGDDPVRGIGGSNTLSASKKFKQGAALTAALAVDLSHLLAPNHDSSLGLEADSTLTVPLMRGAGKDIVTEPLTQAQRDVIYAVYIFEHGRRMLAVEVADQYLDVLNLMDQVANAEENYRELVIMTRRSRNLCHAGRLTAVELDQATQDELSARQRWINAQIDYAKGLDAFKNILNLPTDAEIELDHQELVQLTAKARQAILPLVEEQDEAPASQPAAPDSADAPVELVPPSEQGGPYEMPYEQAIRIALANRLDLRTAIGQVYDAQRKVVVAANGLKTQLDLQGQASVGARRTDNFSANLPDARFNPNHGFYAASPIIDLPLERTAERNAYRVSLIDLEQNTRAEQIMEDQVKLDIRNDLRTLLESRESYIIQVQAAKLAQRRVDSTELFLQAGRAQIRDLLDAQDSLIAAKDAVTAALIDYRKTELELQRDMDVLEVDEKGLWREYEPGQLEQ